LLPQQKRLPSRRIFSRCKALSYIEFYVGNAKQAAHFYKTVFGFQSLAYSGPETGTKEKASYAIRQNKLTFLLTTPLRSGNAIADHIAKHGDGVKAIALKVEDATSAWEETTSRGGKSFLEPMTLTDGDGQLVMSGIHTYGETVHLFIERETIMAFSCPVFVHGNRPTMRPRPASSTLTTVSGMWVGIR
jgi:4-hydroxyphenylpyruvate dioxygenase and related hemolysins